MELQALIDRGEELKNETYDSPIVDMWENDVKAAVAPFGEATMRVLQSAMHFGQVIMSDDHGQHMHIERINKVQKLLEELQRRNPADTQAQSNLITQKKEEAKATLGAKFGKTTFNGPVSFGDNSPANSVQVGELMLAIISQAEEGLPNGPEKDKILSSLKGIVANPTFAAIAGASLPEIIKRLFG
jgi:hypothetical protein